MRLGAAVVAAAVALGLSALATPVLRQLAWRLGMVDLPGRHKAHPRPVPLLGGSAVFLAFLLPVALGLAVACIWAARGVPDWVGNAGFSSLAVHVPGAAARAPMALGILVGALALHVVGLIDDARNLGPWLKLAAQAIVCTAVVVLFPLRVLTVLGEPTSAILTVAWLVALTNAFNFLDNADGLCAGVAILCGLALLGASLSVGQVFVSGLLCLLVGALAGFLPYNFPPASVFLGDAGSLVVGYLLGVASCLTTYVHPGSAHPLYAVFVPLVVMAIPLYDVVSVVLIRLRGRRNPLVGDRWHFSHRLARRGMGPRAVVLTVYLCTAATATAGSLLPRLRGTTGVVLALVQTLCILGVVAMLESGDGRP